jgi:hypothetical protein
MSSLSILYKVDLVGSFKYCHKNANKARQLLISHCPAQPKLHRGVADQKPRQLERPVQLEQQPPEPPEQRGHHQPRHPNRARSRRESSR